ncbi:MAG: hypothetical protein LCI00_11735 [Chloroflexi bacterium]|nr:hypothetical protein [Chloroflexota bacterium]
MSKRRGDWIDEDEYPDERDMDDFGDASPVDYDRSTLGKVGNMRQPYWTKMRILIVLLAGLVLISIILAELAPLLQP